MAQPVQPGSYTALYGQRLIQAIVQLAATNPLAANAGNAGGLSPITAQLDGMLLQNVASMDGMLSTVGLQASSGLAPPNTGNTGGLGAIAQPPQAIQPSLGLNGNLSLTG
jgi:hypothetical protein